MNAIAALYADQALRLANERQAELHSEAALFRRLASNSQPSFQGLRSIGARIKAVFSVVEPRPTLPALSDYPYRG
jgi:hypothetical protein